MTVLTKSSAKKFVRKEFAMNNLCMGGGGQFVSRDEVALIQTSHATASWKPVSHIDVIDSVTKVIESHK